MHTLHRRSCLVVFTVLLALAWTYPGRSSNGQVDKPAAPADPIKDRLERAKEAYRAKLASLKKEVLALLDSKIKDARNKKDNKVMVDALAAQKVDFEKDTNILPPSLKKSRESFAKQMRSARTELVRAYGQAIHDYTGAAKDAQADAVSTERKQFLLTSAATVPYRRAREVPAEQPVPAPRPLLFDPKILISSAWDFTIVGPMQKGAFKIVDCQIRHIDTDHPAGFAEFLANGELHLLFDNHRKIPAGEAVVVKVANGQGRGTLVLNQV